MKKAKKKKYGKSGHFCCIASVIMNLKYILCSFAHFFSVWYFHFFCCCLLHSLFSAVFHFDWSMQTEQEIRIQVIHEKSLCVISFLSFCANALMLGDVGKFYHIIWDKKKKNCDRLCEYILFCLVLLDLVRLASCECDSNGVFVVNSFHWYSHCHLLPIGICTIFFSNK